MRRPAHSLALVVALAGACRVDPTMGRLVDAAVADAQRDAGRASFVVVTAGGPGADVARAIALDRDGNIVIAGSFQGTARFGAHELVAAHPNESFVAKLDPDGSFLWARALAGVGNDRPQAVAVDAAGSIYVATSFTGRSVLAGVERQAERPGDLLVVKLDPTGKAVWSAFATRGPLQIEEGIGIAVDPAGRSTITGSYQGDARFGATALPAAGGTDIFVARLEAGGAFSWTTPAGGVGADRGYAVLVNDAGEAYLTGSFTGQATFGDHALDAGEVRGLYGLPKWRPAWACYVAKVDPAGAFVWARQLAVQVDSVCTALTRGPEAGQVFVAGAARELLDGPLVPTVALVGEGGETLSSLGRLPSGRVQGIARHGVDALTIVGQQLQHNAASGDVLLAQLAGTREVVSTTVTGGSSDDRAYAVAKDSAGNAFVAGAFESGAQVGEVLTCTGSSDLFIWRIAP